MPSILSNTCTQEHALGYTFNTNGNEANCLEWNDSTEIEFEISSLAPTVFYQLRKDIDISNNDVRRSFSQHFLKDFTNSDKSDSLTLAVPAGVISDPTLKNLKICLKYFVVSHFLAATCIPYG